MTEASIPSMRPFLFIAVVALCVTSGLLAVHKDDKAPPADTSALTRLDLGAAHATTSSAPARIKRSLKKSFRSHENQHGSQYTGPKPQIEPTDLIYHHIHNTVPIVNEEYKVIFFQVAKAASSQWVRFFMRLNNDPSWCSDDVKLHNPKHNHLTYLSDYSLSDAQEMMTSPEWTRAIFVRNPKPRLLSAFLDKAVTHWEHFTNFTCMVYAVEKVKAEHDGNENVDELMARNVFDIEKEDCVDHHDDFSFFLYNITTTLGKNVHWRSISSRIDEKWWPSINFVGRMEHLSQDAERFLKTIRSSKRFVSGDGDGAAVPADRLRRSKGDKRIGMTAWDHIGKTGWNGDERDCSVGTSSFLAKRVNHHQTSARDQMLEYYTPELESYVENHFADDLNSHYFHFDDDIKLFGEMGQKRKNEYDGDDSDGEEQEMI